MKKNKVDVSIKNIAIPQKQAIDYLQHKKLFIDDRSKLDKILESYSYSQFCFVYNLPFLINNDKNECFDAEAKLTHLIYFYKQERKLIDILSRPLLDFEKKLASAFLEVFIDLHNENVEDWRIMKLDKEDIDKLFSQFQKQIKKNTEYNPHFIFNKYAEIISKKLNKNKNEIYVWTIIREMTFGEISFLINSSSKLLKKKITKRLLKNNDYKNSFIILRDLIDIINKFRNNLFHNKTIFNFTYKKEHNKLTNFWKLFYDQEKSNFYLYQVVTILDLLDFDKEYKLLEKVDKLFDEINKKLPSKFSNYIFKCSGKCFF